MTRDLLLRDSVKEFLRFCVVGVICTGIDASIFYIFRLFSVYQVALVAGYLISLFFNYFLTVLWTFKKPISYKNAIGVISCHLFNLFVVRMGLMILFVEFIGIDDSYAYWPVLIISVFTNFFILKFCVGKL